MHLYRVFFYSLKYRREKLGFFNAVFFINYHSLEILQWYYYIMLIKYNISMKILYPFLIFFFKNITILSLVFIIYGKFVFHTTSIIDYNVTPNIQRSIYKISLNLSCEILTIILLLCYVKSKFNHIKMWTKYNSKS